VATIFAPYDFVRAIGGDHVDLTMLIPPGGETHTFDPTPQDIIKIQGCDVFIINGGESDEWVKEVLGSIDTRGMAIVSMMDCVEAVEEEVVEGMQEEDADGSHAQAGEGSSSHGEEQAEYDEHVWTSPRNAKLIVQRISDQLCAADPGHAATYQRNTQAYLELLDGLDEGFQEVVDHASRHTLVFGDRFPFRYFVDAYGLDYYAAFPGCSPETEASAATIAFLIDRVREEGIPVVLHIELANTQIAQAIADATGARVMTLHSCHNISLTDFNADQTYISLVTANLDVLREALR
jgi:zinc transport system substrate-binding protein